MMALELHPLCTLFPRLTGVEFEALKADIVANGQREPVVVHEGLVLDGGNRYRACIEAGIEPRLKEFDGADPVAFVLSANLHRRHLTPGQQAAIVSRAQDWASAQAVGRPEKSGNVAGLKTVADRAGLSGASERTQRMADKVAKESPELAQQVAHGEISLPKALEQLAPRAPAPKAAPAIVVPQPEPAAPAPVEQQAEHSEADGMEEADPFDQLMTDFQALQADHGQALARIKELEELLSQNDLAAQVDALTYKCAQFDSLATSRFAEIAGMKETIERQKGFLDMLRKAAGLPKGGDLAAWIKHAAQRAA